MTAGEWVVNKTGSPKNVYDEPYYIADRKVIGRIMNREVCVFIGLDTGPLVYFRNSAGKLASGFIDFDEWPNDNIQYISYYPYSRNPLTLYCRRARKIYKPNGAYYTTVPAGRKLKMRPGDPDRAGYTHPEYIIIDAYENESGGWSTIDGGHGFVDSGIIEVASSYKSIPVYGSW